MGPYMLSDFMLKKAILFKMDLWLSGTSFLSIGSSIYKLGDYKRYRLNIIFSYKGDLKVAVRLQ